VQSELSEDHPPRKSSRRHAHAQTLETIGERPPLKNGVAIFLDKIQKGFYWDEAVLYPAGANWKDVQGSVFWNGPVVRIVPSLENSFAEVH
jgi:hypothetical protein